PQLTFRDKVDNGHSPFVPIIRYKPHSIRPLAVLLENDAGVESYCHPYECEIEHFEATEEQLKVEEQQTAPLPLEETPYVFVETLEQLQHMCTDLGKQTEIAVDLEVGVSCVIRLTYHLEEENPGLFDSTLTVFRSGLCTQDSLLLRRLVGGGRRGRLKTPGMLVAVDLKRAFDTGARSAVLTALEGAGAGTTIANFV
ncbi:unnamed protein product, partial [Ixodes pacificus]